jgi:V8-like Glu-specific endopeptidase
VEENYRSTPQVMNVNCIVRIFNTENDNFVVVGAGILVSPRHILTCAHVVNLSLGKDEQEPLRPDSTEKVLIDFPCHEEKQFGIGEKLSTEVIYWSAMSRQGESLDIAVLELKQEEIGREIEICRGVTTAKGQKVKAYGFPSSIEYGMFAKGKVVGICLNKRILVDAKKDHGYFYLPGFSGAAVWDKDDLNMIGMVVEGDIENKNVFVISSSILEPICRRLRWSELEQILIEDWSQIKQMAEQAYQYATPPGYPNSSAPSDPEALLDKLIDMNNSAEGSAIAKFMAYLAEQLTEERKKRLSELGTRLFPEFLAISSKAQKYIGEQHTANQRSKRPHLLIRADFDDNAKIINLSAWLIIGNTPYANRDFPQNRDFPRWQLKSASFISHSGEIDINSSIRSWIEESQGYDNISDLVIEIFLPIGLFHLPIEKDWKTGSDEKYLTSIGKSYPVVFRDSGRLIAKYTRKDDWKKYWDRLELNAHEKASRYLAHPRSINDFDDVCSCLRSCDELLGIKIATMLPSAATFAALHETAHPVGIWLRRESFDADCQTSLEQFLCGSILGYHKR